jgi:hypothetical protein
VGPHQRPHKPTWRLDGDKCSLTYDNNTFSSVGGNADPDGNLFFDHVLMSQGDHTIHITCTNRDTGKPFTLDDQSIHVGPAASSPSAAAPAAQAASLSGSYTITPSTDQPASTWTLTSGGPGSVHITSSPGWSADASSVGGRWTFTLDRTDAVLCSDGSTGPGTQYWSFDGNTGTVRSTYTGSSGACGQTGSETMPTSFTMTSTG